MSEQSANCYAELKKRLKTLDELYRSAIGLPAEKHYERLIQKTEAALDEMFREEQSDWGKDDDYLLSQWGKAPW